MKNSMELIARRHTALMERYRALKNGELPWWKLIWEAFRPRRSRFTSARRLRAAQRADLERVRMHLRKDHRT